MIALRSLPGIWIYFGNIYMTANHAWGLSKPVTTASDKSRWTCVVLLSTMLMRGRDIPKPFLDIWCEELSIFGFLTETLVFLFKFLTSDIVDYILESVWQRKNSVHNHVTSNEWLSLCFLVWHVVRNVISFEFLPSIKRSLRSMEVEKDNSKWKTMILQWRENETYKDALQGDVTDMTTFAA